MNIHSQGKKYSSLVSVIAILLRGMPYINTSTLKIFYLDSGPQIGWPVVLSHGFPYDVHVYDEVVPILVKAGARIIVPYLRGFGATRFLSPSAMRSGQQAALATDLVALLDGLSIDRAILAGFDWGGVASCAATALFPTRVAGLVSYAGYDIIDVESQRQPCNPTLERVMWYQHLFPTERGRACLEKYRWDLCRGLWEQWSPKWNFQSSTLEKTAPSFENPDFVDIVVHAYRFVFGLAEGDPALGGLEAQLAARPKIVVPAITLDGKYDPLKPGGTADHSAMFTARHEHRTVECGHNLPQEAPEAFADAVLTLHSWLSSDSKT